MMSFVGATAGLIVSMSMDSNSLFLFVMLMYVVVGFSTITLLQDLMKKKG
jgi:hypothetical protein